MFKKFEVTPAFFRHYFSSIAANRLLESLRSFQPIKIDSHYWYAFLQSQQKFVREICGTQTTKVNLNRHRKRCPVGTLFFQFPIFPNKFQGSLILFLVKTSAHQNRSLSTTVTFVIKSFQRFTLYDSIKTPNIAFVSRQHLINQMISFMKLMTRLVKKSCVQVNISSLIFKLKCDTQSIQLCNRTPQRKNCVRKAWSFLQQLKVCSRSESTHWVVFGKLWKEIIPWLSCSRKQYPAGSIQTCVHQRRPGKTKRLFQQNDVTESCSSEKMNTRWRF